MADARVLDAGVGMGREDGGAEVEVGVRGGAGCSGRTGGGA